jgi:MoxR-like ATPase
MQEKKLGGTETMGLEAKARLASLYRFIREELFRCREDLVLPDGSRYSSLLLFEILNYILRTCAAIFGDPGQGKTTSAELVTALFAGLPYPLVLATVIRGSPEISEEKIVGPVDLGALQSGKVFVMWSNFVRSPAKIVDELNRIPEIKQSMILEGIRTGTWLYLGQAFVGGKQPLFATLNFEGFEGGTFQLVSALLDRFSLGLDAGYPGVGACTELALHEELDRKLERLGLCDLYEEALALFTSREFDPSALASFQREFKIHLIENGLEVLSDEEIEALREEILALPLSDDARQFLAFVISALNACVKYRQKRGEQFGEIQNTECPQDCRYFTTPCSWVLGGGSRRQEADLVRFSKALAFIRGAKEVEASDLVRVMPFVIWHRRRFSSQLLNLAKTGAAHGYPLKLEAAFCFAEKLFEEYNEQRDLITQIHKNKAGLRGSWLELMGQKVERSELVLVHVQDLLGEEEPKGGEEKWSSTK